MLRARGLLALGDWAWDLFQLEVSEFRAVRGFGLEAPIPKP